MHHFPHLLLSFSLALASQSASSATFVVDSTAQEEDANLSDGICETASGVCTLPAAIAEAESGGGEVEILLPAGAFPGPGIVQRVGTLRLTLTGAGAGRTTLGTVPEIPIVEGLSIVLLSHSPVSLRLAHLRVGGIVVLAPSDLELDSVAVEAEGASSAIFYEGSALRIERSAIHGWVGLTAGGWTASHPGLGVACYPPYVEIVNSTISGDSSGIRFYDCNRTVPRPSPITVTISSSTITGRLGEGIATSGLADLSLRNSIITAAELDCAFGDSTSIVSLGHTLDSDGSCGLYHPTDLSGVDPLLGPLQDNGGETPTHGLGAASPALDAIPLAACTYDHDADPATPTVPLANDQRGLPRPVGPRCDIGAFEGVSFECGDGTQQPGELCEDGNLLGGDGCSASCIPELCGDGVLEPVTEACDDGNTADWDGCSSACELQRCPTAPEPVCLDAGRARLAIDERRPEREELEAKLSKIDSRNFDYTGDPVGGDTHVAVCLYNGADQPVAELTVDRAGERCEPKGKPCWKTLSDRGYAYADADGSASGVERLILRAGRKGKVRLLARNQGAARVGELPTGLAEALVGSPQARLQVIPSDGVCVEAVLGATRSDGEVFKAKAP
jgi:cysteine-rich repeat protein